MATKGNQKKADLLGISHGAAAHQLRKSLLFNMMQQLNLDACFQCGEKIAHVEHLSIEHKVPWMSHEKPRDAFFDLDNIAFSHLSCNIGAAVKVNKVCNNEQETQLLKNKLNRDYWNRMSKERQQKIRREKYLKYGC